VNPLRDLLFEPLFVAILLLVLSYALARRRPRVAFALPAVALGVLLVCSAPSASNRFIHRMEAPPLTTMRPGVTYDAVIVLGGAINPEMTRETGRTAVNGAAERLLVAFDVLRQGRARNAVVTGGFMRGGGAGVRSQAGIMADQLEAWGIDPSRIVAEEQSSDTHEDAVESVKIARAHGWSRDLLLTTALHVPRARGCFVHEGLDVDTLAVDFRSVDPAHEPGDWFPRAMALSETTLAFHELAGRAVYRLRGWID
jgi:uncharacterized SAM-binding protein YcdF (DUF218 family)